MRRLNKNELYELDKTILDNWDTPVKKIATQLGVNVNTVYNHKRKLTRTDKPEYPVERAVADTCVHEYTVLRNMIVDRISANCAASEDLCFMLSTIKGRLEDWQRRQRVKMHEKTIMVSDWDLMGKRVAELERQIKNLHSYLVVEPAPAPYVPEPDYSKWIGKPCWFWDNATKNPLACGVLNKVDKDRDYPFSPKEGNFYYKHCRPVTADEIVKE